MAVMVLLLRIRTTDITTSLRIHATSLSKLAALRLTAIMSLTALTDGVLQAFSHVTQPSLAKMLQRFANVSFTIWRRCSLLLRPVKVRPVLRTRAAIGPTPRFTMLEIRLGIWPCCRRRRRILGTILIRPGLLRFE
jgi:hypothetical protein